MLLAEHKLTGARVAIKMVPRGWGSQAQLCSRWASLPFRAFPLAIQSCRWHAELLLCGTGQKLQLHSGQRSPHSRSYRQEFDCCGADGLAPVHGLQSAAAASELLR